MSSHIPLNRKMLINNLYVSVFCAVLLIGSQSYAACTIPAATAGTATNAAANPTSSPVSVNNPQLAAPSVVTPLAVGESMAGGGGPRS